MRNGKNHYPMKTSKPFCVPDGWISQTTIVALATEFTIVLGMPKYSNEPRTLSERIRSRFFQRTESKLTHSYYSKDILYLTPDDYKAWVAAIEHNLRLTEAQTTRNTLNAKKAPSETKHIRAKAI